VHLEVHVIRERTVADLARQAKNPRSRRRIRDRAIDFDVAVVVVNHPGGPRFPFSLSATGAVLSTASKPFRENAAEAEQRTIA
jgi:hypothetical protein